jgi:hypothetical protein
MVLCGPSKARTLDNRKQLDLVVVMAKGYRKPAVPPFDLMNLIGKLS